MKRCRFDVLFAFLAMGCGSGEVPATTTTAPPSAVAVAPSASAPPTPVAPPSIVPPPSPVVAPPPATIAPVPLADLGVDLLHAVPTRVVPSSAYHDDASQVPRLVDGDLATAWNARTGELRDAYVDVRIPEGATVRAIQMTVGFTRDGGTTDLFTGNQRISRVWIAKDGAWMGEHDLDVDSRALQTIPIAGGAGVYRIGIAALTPGTRTDWREVCISELRVMGDPGTAAVEGAAPTFDVGIDEMEDARDEATLDAATQRWQAAADAYQRAWSELPAEGTRDFADGRTDADLPAAEAAVDALFVGTDAEMARVNLCGWQATRLGTRIERISNALFLQGLPDDDTPLRPGHEEELALSPDLERFRGELDDLDERLGAEDRPLARAVLRYTDVPASYTARWHEVQGIASAVLDRCADLPD